MNRMAHQPTLRSLRTQSNTSDSSLMSQSRPSSSSLQVSWNPFSRLVHITQYVLRLWIPLLCPKLHLVVETGEKISGKD